MWELIYLKTQICHSWVIYPKDASYYNRNTYLTMFFAALFVIVRNGKQPRCPSMEEWIKKMWYTYRMEYDSAVENNKIMTFVGKWVKLEKSHLE